jgi:hypothetical protein
MNCPYADTTGCANAMNDTLLVGLVAMVVIIVVAWVVISVVTGGGVPDAITRMTERGS